MKKSLKLGIIVLNLSLLWGCGVGITRKETDTYTVSHKDTTSLYEQMNAPGNRDNGIIYPSSKTIKQERYAVVKDSSVDRFYPNFIRVGLYESVGLIGSGSADNRGDYGLFSLFPNFENMFKDNSKANNGLFGGTMQRFLPVEYRLRWFKDSKNWTIGSYAFEIINPDSRFSQNLMSIAPLYIRKRWYLREEIPYVALTPAVGLGWFPSQYINISGSIELGSLGGLNIRAFAGYVFGNNPAYTQMSRDIAVNGESKNLSVSSPYFGLGMSFLDFHNLVPETLREWKDHEHSSWNVGLIQFGLLATTADNSFFYDSTSKPILNGFFARLANAEIAIPKILNNKLYVGTSLVNMIALGPKEWGMGILPIRIGYFTTILADELTTEPFFEYNYYPSNYFHVGNKLNLRISEMMNIGFIIGYASGSTEIYLGNRFNEYFTSKSSFSRPYIGLNIGINDRIFFPEELRYNK